jgi:SNF2 family DNA or RNA helicase
VRDLDLGGVLADDMGLGKTLQVLALLLDTHAEPHGPPSLVVAPTSVVHNWVSEAARFAPELRVHLHHGGGRGDALPPEGEVDVVVTSYALLRFDDEIFGKTPFRYVVLDEAQAIKNPSSQIAQACHALQADHRLAVTGTPLENNLVELWSLFQFLMPGFFGGRTAFNARFTTPVQKYRDEEAMSALRGRIRPFVLRRRKDEVARELPPRTEQVLYCELDPTQRRLYESVKDTYRAQVFGAVETLGLERATIQVLEALTRLRQACCDPRLLPFDEARSVATSAKRTLLTDTLDEILAEGHRTLIFSQWPSLLKLVSDDLKGAGVEYLYLDGSTRDRKSLVERWNAPDGPPVFLISLKAGGTGLNLTGADHVIHLDPWWNPAVEAQATDRAHRIGQTRPVMVYKLVARETVEDKILELQARKKALFDAAVDADRMLVDTLTRADLEAVFAPGR